MASRSGFCSCIILSAYCCFVLALAQNTADQVLEGINMYRMQVGIGALTANAGASCVAKKVLSQYEGTACSNTTGLDTVPGQEPNYPSFPTWLSDCRVGEDRVKDGNILPDCVPSASSATPIAIAILNYTHDSGAAAINDTAYTSAGAASSTNWFVLILATNTSSGDYFQQSGSNSNLGSPTHLTLTMSLLALLSLLAIRSW